MIDHKKLKETRAGSRRQGGWKPREGENKVRILPPHSRFIEKSDELENLAIQYKMHFFRIEGRPTEVSRCLEEGKKRCPACAAWRTHRKSDDPGLKELASQVSPADQYLFSILDHANFQAGIQKWVANWTCWDKIMEIAANPSWGNVVDPSDGVDFTVNMTPSSKSRSGYNAYSVTPEPKRTNVMGILTAIPDWEVTLDQLEDQISEEKEVPEIVSLLEEMGFPTPGGGSKGGGAGGGATPVVVPAPGTAAVTTPTSAEAVPIASAPPEEISASSPATAEPVTIQPPPAAVEVEAAIPTAGREPTTEVHYDPGPEYNPKLPDTERPPGAPRCFGDYDPKIHQCTPCPAITECQLHMIETD